METLEFHIGYEDVMDARECTEKQAKAFLKTHAQAIKDILQESLHDILRDLS